MVDQNMYIQQQKQKEKVIEIQQQKQKEKVIEIQQQIQKEKEKVIEQGLKKKQEVSPIDIRKEKHIEITKGVSQKEKEGQASFDLISNFLNLDQLDTSLRLETSPSVEEIRVDNQEIQQNNNR
eukprot:TRINITY_DN5135_c0_g2_i3.p2 TRINITY_DN5135_c0_g2~~TRINITY_DN5135_c0_g2_i3.p2  ORF type:complete len:123 (+),score=19.79 TRINITY_DN5135_c0_g2_i3:468-836(+)